MRIAIMGAGGLGSYYGAMLARAGEDVHFIARRAHLAAMQADGLHIESAHVGDFHLAPVNATDDPGTIGPVDAVLMGVKAYDLATACEAIRPLLGPETFIVPLLNGVDMAERIGAAVGAERVLGGTCFASSNVLSPGHVRHVLDAPLLFGELAGGRSARGDALEAAFRNAGVNAQQSEHIRRDLWQKYIVVSPLAATCSVVRLSTRQMAAQPAARELYEGVAREVAALARAGGVDIPEDAVDKAMAFIDGVGPQHTVSTLLDLRAERRLELDAMVGTVVRLGEELGVPTPIARVLWLALRPYEDGPPA